MTASRSVPFLAAAMGIMFAGCDRPADHNDIVGPELVAVGSELDAVRDDDWSEPIWLGPVVNSTAREFFPRISKDGLRLYFHSDRAGGTGSTDLYVSHRARVGCPWGPAVNMGPPLNTTDGDGDLTLTHDERVAFMGSGRPGGFGMADIYVTHRIGPVGAEQWSEPINLGPVVNTPGQENPGAYVQNEAGGTLYFNRDRDIYSVQVSRDGEVLGPVVFMDQLNEPVIADGSLTVSHDGKEMIFWSGGQAGSRDGTVGLADLWVTTRQNTAEPFGSPRNLGEPVNSVFPELTPGLSHDGRTLLFVAGAARGGIGANDIWMSTRGKATESLTPEQCGG